MIDERTRLKPVLSGYNPSVTLSGPLGLDG